jgi:hypothetical protein
MYRCQKGTEYTILRTKLDQLYPIGSSNAVRHARECQCAAGLST